MQNLNSPFGLNAENQLLSSKTNIDLPASSKSILEKWSSDQLNKIDDLKRENLLALVQENFNLNLDYIVAITINDKGELITRDGCEWARRTLLNQLPEHLIENVKKTYYYYLNKFDQTKLQYLCPEESLKSKDLKQYYLYLFANDASLSIEQRAKYQLDLGNYYYNEKKEAQHLEKAFYWYLQAAQGGNGQACFNIGHYFYEIAQEGVAKDSKGALAWFKLAAERTQDLPILLYIAQKLEQSQETEDIHSAFTLYQKCASTGNVLGMLFLIDYHQRINRAEDKQIAQELIKMLPPEYQSCPVAETMQKLYRQEIDKQGTLGLNHPGH